MKKIYLKNRHICLFILLKPLVEIIIDSGSNDHSVVSI
ncbi:hypothetical protein J2X69_002619 [Algoriphagus sp. 4150]|nr:hypothetical protein [Algoriphagus sp. 4150]